MQSLIEISGLTKRYGSMTALDGFSMQAAAGEIIGLLGPNGAGKTTLLRLLMGFLRPTAGQATIAGFDCTRQPVAVHAHAAYLPGDVRLFPRMTGRAVLQLLCSLHPASSLPRSLNLADRLELDLSRKVAYCSTGMRQKLAVAATFAVETPLVVLDEPTSNLDPTIRSTVLELVLEAKRAGRTVLFSSHVLSETEKACDRVAILRRGRLAEIVVPGELRRRHRVYARLTGRLPPVPETLAGQLAIEQLSADEIAIDADGELARLLGWLAALPLAEIRIEPVGLLSAYQRIHGAEQ